MAQPRYLVSSALATSLSAAITTGTATSIQLAAMPGTWPTSFPFTILADWGLTTQEAMSVTAVSGSGPFTLTVIRGIDGTTAQAHLINAGVVHGVTEQDFLASATVWWLDSYAGSDDTKMASALSDIFTAGGGTLMLSPRAHSFASQWATTYSAGVATALRIQGAGVAFNGAWGTPTAATTCTFTASAVAAMTDFQHIGTIEVAGIQFKQANTGIPFLLTTNATPNIHDNVFSGGGSGATCATDAILLGGTGTSVGAGDTAKYNAYQGRIYGNFFDGIRRACFFQSAANSVLFFENTVSVTCGSNLVLGACIEFQGNVSKTCTGNQVYANCIECTNYPAPIKLTTFAAENTLGPNGLFDASTPTIAHHYFGTPGVSNNLIIDGYHNAPVPLTLDFNQTNRVISANSSQVASESQVLNFINRSGPPRVNYFGESPIMVESTGNQAYLRTFPGVNPYPVVNVVTIAATQFTDGNVTNGSAYVTSATAVFAATDYGFSIGGTGIPSLTLINWTFTATTAIPWAASFANNLGDVIRPKTANSHLYQCTTAGTTGSSTPTFPTGGGTVTDGTAVWTDLGTGITGCVISVPATATNTGVTLGISRAAGSLQTMTGFSRHHVISTGTAPAVVAAAGAGSGATASVAGNDMAHTLTLNTGTSPASGLQCTVTFNIAYTVAPKIQLACVNANAPAAMALLFATKAVATYTLTATSALAASTTYILDVITMQ